MLPIAARTVSAEQRAKRNLRGQTLRPSESRTMSISKWLQRPAPSREEQEGPACIIPEPRPASQTGIPVDVSLHNGDIKLSDGGLA